MDSDKNKFYFKGSYFQEETDFWEYVQKWGSLTSTKDQRKLSVESLSNQILSNSDFYAQHLSNEDFDNLISKTFICFMQSLFEKYEGKNEN